MAALNKSKPQTKRPSRESKRAAGTTRSVRTLAKKQREIDKALESLSGALLEAALYMPDGFVPLTSLAEYAELTAQERDDAIKASYYYWQRDPLAGRAIQLIRDYTFGRGLSWKATDERVRKVLERFFADKGNRLIARAVGQWELIERVQLAGEVFLIFFVNRLTGAVKVRALEPHEITQIISDPEDKDTVLFYERKWTKRQFDWKTKAYTSESKVVTDYVTDWNVVPPRSSSDVKVERIEHATVGDEYSYVCVHHLKINSHGQRGTPLLLRVLAWVKAYKGFMEDRATLTLALATWAFKQKVKGSKSAVARLAQQWGSFDAVARLSGAGGKERREGAQTLIENENVNLEQLNVNSNAANAYQDGRMLRQQVGAGVGITEQNLTGDPSVANLASATQMEGPMLKMFESWQQLFHDEVVDVLNFVVEMAVQYGELRGLDDLDRTIEVDFPPIVTQDLAVFIGAVSSLISAQSLAGREYIAPQRLARYILQAFGETDVDKALAELPAATPNPSLPAAGSHLPDDQAAGLQAAIESLRQVVEQAEVVA